ncbi:glycosyl transferase family 17, partial [Candidatus Pelagibacter sp.]|nr:glycosyl transferase family 17 [Candidatus Pelagibacter sp.]
MIKNKIYDCITFFDENLLVNSRFEILKDVVDYFIICESNYDHKGNKKKINFKLNNSKLKYKVRHIVVEENFPNLEDGWKCEAYQREKILEGLSDSRENDLIMYSDSDEIPNPNIIKNINLKKKYGIFLQQFFTYKINIFNKYESPWEGTRICRRKDLKSINFMRKKILSKNINKSFIYFKNERNIELYQNGGWHFNNLYDVKTISKKLKVFPHKEFSDSKFSNEAIIENKISNLIDLFGRGHKYEKIE